MKKMSNASLDREFKKQKFLEKMESILDQDDEQQFVDFIRLVMHKKGYNFFTDQQHKEVLSKVKNDTIDSLEYLKNNTILAKNRNIDINKLNDDTFMENVVKELLKELYLDLVSSKKYRIDILKHYSTAVVSVSAIIVDPRKPLEHEGNNLV